MKLIHFPTLARGNKNKTCCLQLSQSPSGTRINDAPVRLTDTEPSDPSLSAPVLLPPSRWWFCRSCPPSGWPAALQDSSVRPWDRHFRANQAEWTGGRRLTSSERPTPRGQSIRNWWKWLITSHPHPHPHPHPPSKVLRPAPPTPPSPPSPSDIGQGEMSPTPTLAACWQQVQLVSVIFSRMWEQNRLYPEVN